MYVHSSINYISASITTYHYNFIFIQKMTSVQLRYLLFTLVHLAQGQLDCRRTIEVNNETGNDTQGCLEGGHPCFSLDFALYNFQSYDCMNITSNTVSLSTVVERNDINAITIRGQGNTTVMCSNNSRTTFKNFSNVVIEEITWNGCGDPKIIANGGINFERITNLFIRNCTLQFSKSRALTIWSVSGFIEMIDTQVKYNANYDPIYCHPDQYGIFRCNTKDFAVTGGVRIQESTGQANVTIINCILTTMDILEKLLTQITEVLYHGVVK